MNNQMSYDQAEAKIGLPHDGDSTPCDALSVISTQGDICCYKDQVTLPASVIQSSLENYHEK